MQHKILILGNGINKEVSLKDARELTIGTDKKSHVWLTGDLFTENFFIKLVRSADDKYRVYFSKNLSTDLGAEDFEIGLTQKVTFRYVSQGQNLFSIEAVADFADTNTDYHYAIDVSAVSDFTIGTVNNADIMINEVAWGHVSLRLKKSIEGFIATAIEGKDAIGVNGAQITDSSFSIDEKNFFSVGNVQFYVNNGKLYTKEDDRLICKFQTSVIREQNNQLHYPEFIKNVRLQFKQPVEPIEVIQPSEAPSEPEGDLISKILPTIIMMVMMTVMRFTMSSNKMYAIYFIVMMLMTVSTTVIAFKRDKKKYVEKSANRINVYNKYIDKKDNDIQIQRQDEKLVATKMNILPQETVEQIENFDARLFEKDKSHEDFLDVPIGTGVVKSVNQVDFKKQESLNTEDPLMEIPENVHDKYEKIADMPVVLHLKDSNAIGFLGTRSKLYQMAKNLLITIAGQHFYQDVKYFIMLDPDDVQYFDWVRWLQNCSNGGQRNIICDENSKKPVLEALYNELNTREGMNEKERDGLPHYIVFAYRSSYMSGHPITNYVEKAKDLGFTFLFFEEYKELLHKDCDELVCLDRETYNGFIQKAADAVKTQEFTYTHLAGDSVAAAALKLACVHVNEISLESTLTKNITLYQLLHVMSAYDLNVGQRWKNSNVAESMAAPLGVDASGEIVYLDLHEKAHGPHGLVAGTTGSGKSEILQSYVLSACTLFHPYEVAFVIIDFKGGGMANQFRNLPHLNGAITNIDGKQIDRSLMSIKAELMKRQKLFAEYDVNKIDDYIELFKAGKTPTPLPHLILIVDEFAELKSEQPEFMKELISAARIGRSLGMHLILATQKPAGVVNDQIWSNSKFKLCLKVQDKSDSKEVIKSPLAAEIREPGRAYLQVGNNEIFTLFQSAYSGASVNVEMMEQTKKFEINVVDFAGRRQTIYQQKPKKVKGNGETQLDAIVTYLEEYCKDNGIKRLPDICLPPLAENIPFPEKLEIPEGETDIILPIGIYDDPSSQYQGQLTLNLTKDNVYIAGSALTGKTNLMQTLIRGLCDKYTAGDITIYIIDFASMMLRNFDGLNQVGGVVTLSEDTKLRQLLEMVLSTIEERKQILSVQGLSSFSAYREAGLKDMKQVVLMIENYGMLHATYPDYEGYINNICRDGVAVGVSVVMTNTLSQGLGMKMMTYFGEKISLFQNDSTQYAMLYDHCKLFPDNTPGRGIVKRDNTIREFQTYIAFSAEKEVEKVSKIRDFVATVNAKNKGFGAKKIPTIPALVTEDYILEQYELEEGAFDNYNLPMGIRYEDIQPAYLSLAKENLIGIMGRDELGRARFVKYLLDHVYRNSEKNPVELYVIDDVSREIEFVKDWPITKAYTTNSKEVEGIMMTVFEAAKANYASMTQDAAALDEKPMMLLIFNSLLTEDMLGIGKNSNQVHDLLVNKLKGCKVCIMHSNINNVAVSYKSSALMKQLSEQCAIVAFEDAKTIKLVSAPSNVVRSNTKKMETGDAFYIKDGAFEKMRTTLSQKGE